MGFLSGLGLGNNSATSQSDPFYNDSGIYFDSPGAGVTNAGASTADASATQSRQLAQGNAPVAGGVPAPLSVSSGYLPYIIGGAALLLLGVFVILKRK